MFNPFHRRIPLCPVCGGRIFRLGGHGPLRCAFCNSELYVPIAYARWIWVLVVVLLSGLGVMTYSVQHTGTWLLLLLLLSVAVRALLGILIPPWFQAGRQNVAFPFLLWYVIIAITLPVSVIGLGWFHVLIGASKSEISDLMVTFSLPLGWIRSDFIIDPTKNFFDVCGIVLGNSFFYALGTFAVWRGAHTIIRRNRVTAINIEGHDSADEDQ